MRRPVVVVTGAGVVAPNGIGLEEFDAGLRSMRSGITWHSRLAELGFGCQVAGVPPAGAEYFEGRFSPEDLRTMNSNMRFAALAALEAWERAGLPPPHERQEEVDWETGAVIGTGIGGIDVVGEVVVPLTDAGRVRRLGSSCVERIMGSNVSAKVGGLLGLGNQVTSNSSACATGTEAVCMAAERIRAGKATRMLAGGSEAASHYIWAAFDAMRVTARRFNDRPSEASRPLSASAAGFVPAAGAAVLVLEDLESARNRGAPILAEVAGVAVNCGGQRMGGSMTAPNVTAIVRVICDALADAGIDGADVDLICGHLTGTFADPLEVKAWAAALGVEPARFPTITATKSLIGHALGAAGAIECVAALLMLAGGYVHGSANCEDLHPALSDYAAAVPHRTRPAELRVVAKASFGFGDVNSCVIFRRWEEEQL